MERMCLIFMYTWLCKGLPFIGSKPNNIPCLHIRMPYNSVAMCASGRAEFESRIPLKILFACYTVKTSTTLKPDQSHFLCALQVFFVCFDWGKTEFRTQSIWSDFFVHLYDGKFCNCWWIELTVISSTKQSLYCILDLENVNREIGALTHQHESLTKKNTTLKISTRLIRINVNNKRQ